MHTRSRMISFVAGASESGKTILVRKLTTLARQPRIIIDPAGSWGEEGVWEEDPWVPIARVLKEGFEGTIVLDDADSYLGTTGGRATWGKLWTQHRHLGVDVIAIVRRVQEIPRIAWSSCERLFVFRMVPGSPAEQYLHANGYLHRSIEPPRERFEFIECDLFGEKWIRRKLTEADLRRYGNPHGH